MVVLRRIVSENARIAQDQAEYQARYNELVSRYDAVKGRHTFKRHLQPLKRSKMGEKCGCINFIRQLDKIKVELIRA
jgi:hypothetical protein